MRPLHVDEDTFPVFNPSFVARVHASRRRTAALNGGEPGASVMQRPDRVRKLLARGLDDHATVKQIISYVGAKHGFTYEELLSSLRTREMVKCRDEAILEVKQRKPEMSLPSIGRAFGGRDHTSILHSLRKSGYVGPQAQVIA